MLGVGAQIHQNLVDLGRVSQDSGLGGDALFYFDGGGQRGPQELDHLLYNETHLNRRFVPSRSGG
jgi:hypothetical protein